MRNLNHQFSHLCLQHDIRQHCSVPINEFALWAEIRTLEASLCLPLFLSRLYIYRAITTPSFSIYVWWFVIVDASSETQPELRLHDSKENSLR